MSLTRVGTVAVVLVLVADVPPVAAQRHGNTLEVWQEVKPEAKTRPSWADK